jgi:3-deoxy-D-manno-octulosonic-acid transferase
VENFAEVYAALDEAGGARRIAEPGELPDALAEMIADPKALRDMARAASAAIERLTGALERTMHAIAPYFGLEAR